MNKDKLLINEVSTYQSLLFEQLNLEQLRKIIVFSEIVKQDEKNTNLYEYYIFRRGYIEGRLNSLPSNDKI